MATVRALSKPGQPLSVAAPTRTLANPAWWIDGDPTPSRDALHERLLQEYRDTRPEPGLEAHAIVLAGPPGAGKGRIREELLAAEARSYLVVDADEFKRLLLREAQSDGSYESWIKPAAVGDLERAGEPFFPLELAALVHEESSYLAKALRVDAIESGQNIVIDTVLGDADYARRLGEELEGAGYSVEVVDVEVPFEISERRIRQRWREAYEQAVDGGDPLGGRWVPSEYARDVFDGPGGLSRPEHVAQLLADECEAVFRRRVYRTTAEADAAGHSSEVVVDWARPVT